MRSKFRIPAIVIPALALLPAVGRAEASVSTYVEALGAGTWRTDSDNARGASPVATSHAKNSGPGGGGAYTSSGEGLATATPGSLHATVSGSTSSSPQHASSLGCARANAYFFDILHVTSTSLAAGTPVRLTLTQSVSGIFDGQGAYRGTVYSSFSADNSTSHYSKWNYTYLSSNETPSGTLEASPIYVNTFVGASFGLSGFLEIAVQTGHGWYNGGSLTVDYGHTANYYASSNLAGVSLTGDSGHNYAQPVPEPATCAALGAGALAFVRRRRRG